MNEHEAQRFLNEQRYQAELPFPVSAVFTHYARSSSKNYALRSLQLVASAQSTIRYAAIVAACDYATSPDPDETLLNWLRQEWLGGKKPSFGTWYGALMRLLAESWKHPFVPEFGAIDHDLMEKKIQPLIHSRNVEIGHAEYYEALALKHFVELQEENLYAILDQFSFLSRYPLAFAEVEEDYTTPSQGTKQAVNICRGASHNFARYTVIPSHPLPPGIPFIWNPEYTSILTLSPFLIFGRATTDAEQKERIKGVAHIQGLMVLNGVPKCEPMYTSVDAEAQFSLEAFEFPPKGDIQEQVESVLKKGINIPVRNEARLSSEEQDLLVRTTDYIEPVYEKESAPALKGNSRLKTIMISAIIGLIILGVGYALYSRFMVQKQHVKSIAVLAFEDNSPTKNQEYLGDGIANTIIDKLNTLSGLMVIASTSSFLYKGEGKKSIKEIGKELNVEYVLEGTVQKAETRLQVAARLIRTKNESLVFSSKPYDRDYGDIFSIQEDIATNVARELKGELNLKEKDALAKHPTSNPEAWDLYMMGKKCMGYWVSIAKKEDYEKALSYFQKTITLEPRFAEAFEGMAWSYYHLSDFPNARKCIKKSLEIKDDLPMTHLLMARLLSIDWQFSAAEEKVKKAISLNPNLAASHFFYAQFLRCMGRYDEALGEIERARVSDPLYIPTYAQAMAIYIDQAIFDKAKEMFQKAEEIDPGNAYPLNHMGRLCYFTGKYEEALKMFQERCKILGIDPFTDLNIGVTYALWGKRDKAEGIIKAIETDKTISDRNVFIAYIYAALGDKEKAFEWLEKACLNHESYLAFLKADAEFKKIRSDPRYNEMLKKIGLPID